MYIFRCNKKIVSPRTPLAVLVLDKTNAFFQINITTKLMLPIYYNIRKKCMSSLSLKSRPLVMFLIFLRTVGKIKELHNQETVISIQFPIKGA